MQEKNEPDTSLPPPGLGPVKPEAAQRVAPALDADGLRREAEPLHQVVKRRLTDAILSGALPAGTVLPAELELAQSYGIAVGTLRKALLALTEEGLLARRRKTGTVVTGRSPQLTLRFLVKYFRLHGLDGRLVTGESRSIGVTTGPADAAEAAALHLPEGTALRRYHRLRLVEERPVMVDRYAVEAARLAGAPPDSVPPQLYLHLEQVHGLRLSAVREALGAELDAEAAAALSLPPGAPLLRIDEVAYDDAGRPAVLAVHHADTTRFRYVNEIR